jgi:hypothetical protein
MKVKAVAMNNIKRRENLYILAVIFMNCGDKGRNKICKPVRAKKTNQATCFVENLKSGLPKMFLRNIYQRLVILA